MKYVLGLKEARPKHTEKIGTKGVNTGQVRRNTKIPVNPGFIITSNSIQEFLDETNVREKIERLLDGVNPENPRDLQRRGEQIRAHIKEADIPPKIRKEITKAYQAISNKTNTETPQIRLQTTQFNNHSSENKQPKNHYAEGKTELIKSVKESLASIYSNRAIEHKEKNRQNQTLKASITVQKLDRSKIAVPGTACTFSPRSGSKKIATIWPKNQLQENRYLDKRCQEIYVFKENLAVLGRNYLEDSTGTVLTENQYKEIAKQSVRIEEELGTEANITWILNEDTNAISILDVKKEEAQETEIPVREYLENRSEVLMEGKCLRTGVKSGSAKIVNSPKDIDQFKEGDILVTDIFSERWIPFLDKAEAVITNRKIPNSIHSTVLNQETPFLTCTENATTNLEHGKQITLECTVSDGKIWDGRLETKEREYDISDTQIDTDIYVEVSGDDDVFRCSQLPVKGARINNLNEVLPDETGNEKASEDAKTQYIDTVKSYISKVCGAFYPRPVAVALPSKNHTDTNNAYEENRFKYNLKAVKMCLTELDFENINLIIKDQHTIEETTKLKSQILDQEPKLSTTNIQASVSYPSTCVRREDLIEEFNQPTVQIGSLKKNMFNNGNKLSEGDKSTKKITKNLINDYSSKNRKVCLNLTNQKTSFLNSSIVSGINAVTVQSSDVPKAFKKIKNLEKNLTNNKQNRKEKSQESEVQVNPETSIGKIAGEIYEHLEQEGETHRNSLLNQVGLNVEETKVHQALGWLAKEGKISIYRRKDSTTYVLNQE